MLRWLIRSKPAPRPDLPIPDEVLEAYRLKVSRTRNASSGLHLHRRAGHALDFREYRGFVPGDDVRFVDWRASARSGAPGDRVLRVFEAEQNLMFGLCWDGGATMRLPAGISKRTVALWLVRALARIGSRPGDRVLIQAGAERCEPLAGRAAVAMADRAGADDANFGVSVEAAVMALGHAGLLVLISDFYAAPDRGLLEALSRFQRRRGLVLAIELDTWPAERANLLNGAAELRRGDRWDRVEATENDLDDAETRIAQRIAEWQRSLDLGGLLWTRWCWPEHPADMAEWFEAQFLRDPQIGKIVAGLG